MTFYNYRGMNMIILNRTATSRMVRLYEKNNWALVDVAFEFGLSIPTVRRLLVDAGVTIRPRGRVPQTA